MSASREPGADARRWMSLAEEDAQVTMILLADVDAPPRAVCWHAQQTAEKALKAALVAQGVSFPKTHNLVALRAMLSGALLGALDVAALAELTQWASEARYPGDWTEPSDDVARAAALHAAEVLQAVRDHVAASRPVAARRG